MVLIFFYLNVVYSSNVRRRCLTRQSKKAVFSRRVAKSHMILHQLISIILRVLSKTLLSLDRNCISLNKIFIETYSQWLVKLKASNNFLQLRRKQQIKSPKPEKVRINIYPSMNSIFTSVIFVASNFRKSAQIEASQRRGSIWNRSLSPRKGEAIQRIWIKSKYFSLLLIFKFHI